MLILMNNINQATITLLTNNYLVTKNKKGDIV